MVGVFIPPTLEDSKAEGEDPTSESLIRPSLFDVLIVVEDERVLHVDGVTTKATNVGRDRTEATGANVKENLIHIDDNEEAVANGGDPTIVVHTEGVDP
ncbi:hypothetical protein F0562_001339 [Nyssa sinensis]|uniref:Uncharacterized protein n=1 Tax=Nyssa sinensis TaxID=561372 RepID=A0A5J5C2J4_9ASTE|nr:hypothetical protein F0562_001339 [Nyssa sinensis]